MNRVLNVSDINNYIKAIISHDVNLSGIYVAGEISNFKKYPSGHMYFSLKDSGGVLKCVMFRGQAVRLDFLPEDGMKAVVYGSIGVYERDGVYQLYAESIRPDGTGALYEQFEKLKKKLENEGYFDPAHKKPLPLLPRRIAAVTSPSGDVIRDIMNVTSRRFPGMEVLLYPASVQGAAASQELISALKKAESERLADVIIIGRGGGSMEDLWCFNDESLAMAVYNCGVPVISAVGHETDFTICDFVADLRAPTPSAAAELAVPEKDALLYTVSRLGDRLLSRAGAELKIQKARLERSASYFKAAGIVRYVEAKKELVNSESANLSRAVSARLKLADVRLSGLEKRLKAADPENILNRGYAIIKSDDGGVITGISEFEKAGRGILVMKDGETTVIPAVNAE